MKNDLDFIKDKIENSGVKAPKDMDERYVSKTIENVTPRPVVVEPKHKRRAAAIAISATAAGLVIVIALGIVLHTVFTGSKTSPLSLSGNLELRQFQSRDEVCDEITQLRAKAGRSNSYRYDSGWLVEDYGTADGYVGAEEGSADGSSGSSNGSAKSNTAGGSSDSDQSASYSETYKQVDGVDEADIIKTDGKYIYCADTNYNGSNKIVIFTADGQNSKKAAEINVFGDDDTATEDEATPDEFDYWEYYTENRSISDLYLKDDRLIVICYESVSRGGKVNGMSEAKVYDVSNIDHIEEVDAFTQRGSTDSSRMIGDTLYLVSSYTPSNNSDLPICGRGENPDEIPADCIYGMSDNDTDSFLVIGAYDTLDHTAQTKRKSILGSVDDIYCNLDHMYIYGVHREEKWYHRFNFINEVNAVVTTQILKVDLADGIEFSAYAEIPGVIDDQYALDEYEDYLRVATTTKDVQDSNNLFVLDKNLSIIGSVDGFARNEQIKAVRYVGDTAYVITYKQTDPLFVIDLSKPTDPKILGEAKITGFSTMLVPIDENTILGLGYQTSAGGLSDSEVQNGLKIVLFDVSDKLNPQVLDTLVYENCSSEVQYNPKALVYNPDRGDYIVPLNRNYWRGYDAEVGDYIPNEEYYGGALNFKVENDHLKEIGLYQVQDKTIDRCVYVGDNVYMTYRDSDYELQIVAVPYKES